MIVFQPLRPGTADDSSSSQTRGGGHFKAESVTCPHAVMQADVPARRRQSAVLLFLSERRLRRVSTSTASRDRQSEWWLVLQAERQAQTESCLCFGGSCYGPIISGINVITLLCQVSEGRQVQVSLCLYWSSLHQNIHSTRFSHWMLVYTRLQVHMCVCSSCTFTQDKAGVSLNLEFE